MDGSRILKNWGGGGGGTYTTEYRIQMVLELVAFCAWQWIDKVTLIDPWLLGETDPNSGCNIPVVLVLRRPRWKSASPAVPEV